MLVPCNIYFFTTFNLFHYAVGGGFPDGWFGRLIPGRQVLVDSFFQFLDAVETAPANPFGGDLGKPAFHLIEPGTAPGSEVKVKPSPLLWLQPALHRRP